MEDRATVNLNLRLRGYKNHSNVSYRYTKTELIRPTLIDQSQRFGSERTSERADEIAQLITTNKTEKIPPNRSSASTSVLYSRQVNLNFCWL